MSSSEKRAKERQAAIDAAVADIRAIEAEAGVSEDGLARIRDRLIALAGRTELFPVEDFPKPPDGTKIPSAMYRLSEDDDHRFALYLNSAKQGVAAPPHDHTTWAVIVGMEGEEENRMYAYGPGKAPVETGRMVVKAGTGATYLPEDLHSIHIDGADGAINFHMYGLALEQLHKRRYYNAEEGRWIVFPAHSDIREARAGR